MAAGNAYAARRNSPDKSWQEAAYTDEIAEASTAELCIQLTAAKHYLTSRALPGSVLLQRAGVLLTLLPPLPNVTLQLNAATAEARADLLAKNGVTRKQRDSVVGNGNGVQASAVRAARAAPLPRAPRAPRTLRRSALAGAPLRMARAF